MWSLLIIAAEKKMSVIPTIYIPIEKNVIFLVHVRPPGFCRGLLSDKLTPALRGVPHSAEDLYSYCFSHRREMTGQSKNVKNFVEPDQQLWICRCS